MKFLTVIIMSLNCVLHVSGQEMQVAQQVQAVRLAYGSQATQKESLQAKPAKQVQSLKKTLRECVEIAIDSNLALQSGKIAVARAEELQGTAFNINKTTFTMSQDPTSGGSPDNSLSAAQIFDFPTVYISRRGLLKAETNLEQSNLAISRNELTRQVSVVYYRLLYAMENVRILHEQDSIYRKFVFLATAKFKAGETNRLEVMNAERLYNENLIELQAAQNALQTAQIMLQRLMNVDYAVVPAEQTLTVFQPDFEIEDFNLKQTLVNQFYENKLTVSEKSLSLAKQEFLPSLNFTLRSQFLLPGYNPYNIERKRFAGGNFMGFEVGLGIPLFFGEQAAKTRAARRELEMIKTQREDAMQELAGEYRIALNEYAKAKTTLNYYLSEGNRQAAEISRMSQLAYEKGEIGYIEYIQNLKTAFDVARQSADAINAYNQAVILLQYLRGYTN